MNKITRAITIGLLLIAMAKLPYDYYTLLRFWVSLFAAYEAYKTYKDGSLNWALAFSATALLYNPFFKIHLLKATWIWVNLATAILFGLSFKTSVKPIKSTLEYKQEKELAKTGPQK
jgi:predicted membrane protein